MEGKEILAIVPARGGSKGVKRKNIRLLGQKPLINWTLDEAAKSKYIDRLIVSTDDDEIERLCKNQNIEVIKRPSELAQDQSGVNLAVLHTLETLAKENYEPDDVILLQCTSPFRTVCDIDEAISRFITDKKGFTSLISVVQEEDPPYWLKKINKEGQMIDFMPYDKKHNLRRQDFEKVYKLNGAIYISTVEALKQNNGFFDSGNTLAFEMNRDHSIDIDTEEDLAYAQYKVEKEKLS